MAVAREAQAVQQLARARGGVVTVHLFQPVVGIGHRLPVLGRQRVGLGLERGGHLHVAGQHEVQGGVRK